MNITFKMSYKKFIWVYMNKLYLGLGKTGQYRDGCIENNPFGRVGGVTCQGADRCPVINQDSN